MRTSAILSSAASGGPAAATVSAGAADTLSPGALHTGRVIARGEDNWLVQGPAGSPSRRLHRAASCLLDPQVGDTIAWLSRMADAPPAPAAPAAGWIVHVLEREAGATASVIAVDGDLHLKVAGLWQVRSASLKLDTGDAQVRAGDVRASFSVLRLVGQALEQTVRRVSWVGEEFSAVVNTWLQHAKTHRRHTQGLESVQAGTLDLRAEQLARVQAPLVLTEGSDLVKTRGAQIHFG